MVLQSHLDINSQVQPFHQLEWVNEVPGYLWQLVAVMKIYPTFIEYLKYLCFQSATKEVADLVTNLNHGASCENHHLLSCVRAYLH